MPKPVFLIQPLAGSMTHEELRKTMKTLVACVAALALGTTLPVAADPTLDFNASPINYQNSELNYDNSPLNFRDSTFNYDNSPLNPRSGNGIYNSDGHRIGPRSRVSRTKLARKTLYGHTIKRCR